VILNGVLHITGEHDTGKTTMALECGAQPSRICAFDDDMKGQATVDDLVQAGFDFGAYHDLTQVDRGKTLLEFHDACLDLINAIKPGQFDVIIWDTWTRFANTCRMVVKANPGRFRGAEGWAASGRIKGAEMNKEGTLYEAQIIDQLTHLAPTVILVTHLKDQYLNNVNTGKEIPAHGRTLSRVSRMRVWLRQNPSGRPVPIALFLKRFDKKIVTEDGLRTVCVVPRKITPLDSERSVWDAIWRYWENPVGDRPPTPEETPNEFELSILDGILTPDQRRTYQMILKSGVLVEDDEEPVKGKPENSILSLAEQGKSAEEIAKQLGKPLPVVKRVLEG